jgi:hypothetical protein
MTTGFFSRALLRGTLTIICRAPAVSLGDLDDAIHHNAEVSNRALDL